MPVNKEPNRESKSERKSPSKEFQSLVTDPVAVIEAAKKFAAEHPEIMEHLRHV
jgi:hypothetical protein